jgi:hypothetical protein
MDKNLIRRGFAVQDEVFAHYGRFWGSGSSGKAPIPAQKRPSASILETSIINDTNGLETIPFEANNRM